MLTALAITLGCVAFAGVLTRLALTVRGDGYGHRPAPRSERDWAAWTEIDA